MENQIYVKRGKKFTFSLLIIGFIVLFSIQPPLFKLKAYFVNNPQLRTSKYENYNTLYTIEKSVNLNVDINLQIKNGPEFYPCYIEIPRFKSSFPYQEVDLLKFEFTSDLNTYYKNYIDTYNNEFDYFKIKFQPYEEFILQYKYNLTLNYVVFNTEGYETEEYDVRERIFELYCNNSEKNYNIYDPDLVTISNKIVNLTDNPVEKANKIFKWIISYLEYEKQEREEKGASWAYDNKKGDCSEFSSLFITLLRIQNIPARKVVGFVFPELSNTQENFFMYSKQTDNLKSHAWTEYYLPNIGWVACDPTWNYFNMMDNARIIDTKGSQFYFPPDEQLHETLITEFSNFAIQYFDEQEYEYTVNVVKIMGEIDSGVKGDDGVDIENIKVFDTEEFDFDTNIQYSLICFFIILAGICFLCIIKRK